MQQNSEFRFCSLILPFLNRSSSVLYTTDTVLITLERIGPSAAGSAVVAGPVVFALAVASPSGSVERSSEPRLIYTGPRIHQPNSSL